MAYTLRGAHGWTYDIRRDEDGIVIWDLRHEETGLRARLDDYALTVSRPSEEGEIGTTILTERISELPFSTTLTMLNNIVRDERQLIKSNLKTKKRHCYDNIRH